MGQKFSLNNFTPDVTVFLQKYFPNYKIIKSLNNGMLNKTVLISIDDNSAPLILKIFFKNNYDENDKTLFNFEYEKMKDIRHQILNKQINNICPILNMENNLQEGMIYRQYVEYDLKERIYLMPYLQHIEKIWITFQILYALNDLKQMNIIHGDLKPENILLSSNLSVYITDFASYKPAFISIDDITNYTYYFGTNKSNSMKGCYLAPERLVEKNNNNMNNISENIEKTFAMDIFSAGAIIAELFLERNIFDYTSLLNYKKGNKNLFNIDEILSKIQQKNIRALIYKMIAINPEERIDITEALKTFSNEVCPTCITGFLFHFNCVITSTKFWRPDFIIGHIYRYWTPIWKIIFGPNEEPVPLKQCLNFSIVNKIILEEPFSINGENKLFVKNKDNKLCIGEYEFIFNPENGKLYKKFFNENNDDEKNNINCLFIIINYILEAMQYTKYDTTNLVAMEMINIISKKLPDVTKLQLILPYFISNLKRGKYITKLKSLNYIFEILYSINYKDLILPMTEYNYFDSYVFPALLKFYKKENPYIILEFFNNVDKIIDLEEKFLNATLKSRLKKNQLNLQYSKSIEKDRTLMNQNSIILEEREEDSASILKTNSKNNVILDDNIEYSNTFKSINDSELNDNYRISSYSYHDRNSKISKDKTYEIYNDYDTSLESFKDSLFSVTRDLIGRNNEIDILITVIRKLPSLLLFYGRSKTNDFSKFIINNFNKTDWLVQKEMLSHIPQMISTMGEKALNDYILPCMEMLISNNSNELKILELIKSIHQLIKMEYLSLKNSIDFYEKLLPFFLHPNQCIRNEMINFSESLFNSLSPDEIFCYLYHPFENYLTIPPIILNKDTLITNSKKPLPRVIYQLELEINYDQVKMIDNKKNWEEITNKLNILKDMIENQRKGNLMAEDNGNINYKYDNFCHQDFIKQIDDYKKYSLLEPLEKYIKKELSQTEIFIDKGFGLETKIFGKIFWLGNDKDKFSFPNFISNSSISFENNYNIISSDLFRIIYIFKTLDISMKMFMLEDLLNLPNEDEVETLDKKMKSMAKINNILNNYYYNKSFNNWRPQGQIITSLYDHKTIPVEKLLPFDSNHFCSFDKKGNAILYNVSINFDDEITFKKKWEYRKENDKNEKEILNKNTICNLDDLYFAVSLGNCLYQYNPNISPKIKDVSIKLCDTVDNSNISCIKSFGFSSKENQKILFCTEKGSINLYDNRTSNKVSLYYNIPKEIGIMSCICESFENNQFLIGTLDGCLLKYDLRVNSISKSFQYYNNSSIIGINLFRLSKNNEFDFNSFDKNSNYIILWTGGEEHEIGFWNYSDMNCDLLLKLNIQSNGNNELSPLVVDIPYFENNIYNNDINTTNISENKINDRTNKIRNNFSYLNKYSFINNNNIIKRNFFSQQIKEDNYETVDQKLSNISNIYDSPNTVQSVLCPFYDYSMATDHYTYYNAPYVISAGNDKVIRYWDISKEYLNTNISKKSYIINAPNNINFCQFTKGVFDRTNIIQSNEIYNSKRAKLSMPGLSEFQNYNGVLYHTLVQKEFESDSELKHCTKISDPSHDSIITDLLPLSINGANGPTNILLSSSLDGTVKIWK